MNKLITGVLDAFCAMLVQDKILMDGEEVHLVDKFMKANKLEAALPNTNWKCQCNSSQEPPQKQNEDFKLSVKRYRDKKGRPTCASNFATEEVCVFYRTERFGTNDTCVFASVNYKYKETMERYLESDGIIGCMIPLRLCPIWKDEQVTDKK